MLDSSSVSTKGPCPGIPTPLVTAQSAFHKIQFYTELYEVCPETWNDVRFISRVQFQRARGILNCIDRTKNIAQVVPPYDRNVRRFPFTVVESAKDLQARQKRIVRALRDIGVQDGEILGFLLYADDGCGPFACDLSTGFAWEGHRASIAYFTGRREDIRFQIEAHQPDFIVWCLPYSPDQWVDLPADRVLCVLHMDYPMPCPIYPGWLFADEVNLIGSRPVGREEFAIDKEQFYLEWDAITARPSLTTLSAEMLPLIRYCFDQPIPGWV